MIQREMKIDKFQLQLDELRVKLDNIEIINIPRTSITQPLINSLKNNQVLSFNVGKRNFEIRRFFYIKTNVFGIPNLKYYDKFTLKDVDTNTSAVFKDVKEFTSSLNNLILIG